MARKNITSAAKEMYDDYVHSKKESPVAHTLEEQSKLVPSHLFLWAAFASIAVSASLQIINKKERSLFIGQWAPTLILLGIYNKIVKEFGAD